MYKLLMSFFSVFSTKKSLKWVNFCQIYLQNKTVDALWHTVWYGGTQ